MIGHPASFPARYHANGSTTIEWNVVQEKFHINYKKFYVFWAALCEAIVASSGVITSSTMRLVRTEHTYGFPFVASSCPFHHPGNVINHVLNDDGSRESGHRCDVSGTASLLYSNNVLYYAILDDKIKPVYDTTNTNDALKNKLEKINKPKNFHSLFT